MMPPVEDTTGGTRSGFALSAKQENPLSTKTTCDQPKCDSTSQEEAWQSWASTVRVIMIQLANAMPTAAVIWLIYLRR